MISPCRSCSLEYADKNNDTCMRCAKRIKYVQALEGFTASVPVEMTDMAISRIGIGKAKEHDDFIMSHPEMKAPEVAKALGRSTAGIYNRRHALGLTKHRGASESIKPSPMLKPDFSEDPAQAPPVRAEITRSADLVLINVNGHKELYERLKRSAQDNFRTPELQALWFIHQGLAAEGGAGDQRRAPDGTS